MQRIIADLIRKYLPHSRLLRRSQAERELDEELGDTKGTVPVA